MRALPRPSWPRRERALPRAPGCPWWRGARDRAGSGSYERSRDGRERSNRRCPGSPRPLEGRHEFALPCAYLSVVGGERQESDVTSALDRDRHFTLVLGAHARDATGHDLAAIGHEVPEHARVLVIDDGGGVRAEGAATTTTARSRTILVALVHSAIASVGTFRLGSHAAHSSSSWSKSSP